MCNRNISKWNSFTYLIHLASIPSFPLQNVSTATSQFKSRGCANVEGMDGSLVF